MGTSCSFDTEVDRADPKQVERVRISLRENSPWATATPVSRGRQRTRRGRASTTHHHAAPTPQPQELNRVSSQRSLDETNAIDIGALDTSIEIKPEAPLPTTERNELAVRLPAAQVGSHKSREEKDSHQMATAASAASAANSSSSPLTSLFPIYDSKGIFTPN